MINQKRLTALLQKLISINSENPPGDERRIAYFVQGYLKNLGINSKRYEFAPRRTNILATLKGRGSSRSLLITPHLDTVPAGINWKVDPFAGQIISGKVYGLGATDCKANVACSLETINSLIEERETLDYQLIFAATADEESGSDLGLIPLLEKGILKPDAAVVLDADDFEIIVTQKGLMHLKVKVEGIRAHGAYPWRGINAIDAALQIIRDIKAAKQAYLKNKYLRPPTINTGTIRGGDKVNVVADWCEFELDFRFLPGSNAQDLLKKLKTICKIHAKKFKIEIEGIQEPYCIEEDHPLVGYLKKAMRKVNLQPKIKGSEGATVITFFQHKNIPAVATGFGSSGTAHSANEFVKLNNLYKGARALEVFLKSYKFKRS